MQIEIVAIGRELLRGRLADGNAKAIAEMLARRGGLVHRITIVDDQASAIRAAVSEALQRNPNLVITTGGLGPAPDDVTLAAVAAVLELPLALNNLARGFVEQAYQRLHKTRTVSSSGMNRSREKLCLVPLSATPIDNPRGIAPGVVCRLAGGAAVVCLPGHPKEMKSVLEAALAELGEPPRKSEIVYREVESPTADESSLLPLLESLATEHDGVWISSRTVGPGREGHRVLVTFETTAPTREEADTRIAAAVRRLLALASGAK
jgi:molybdenum cofactor synthesis domain-containing protein